MAAPSVPVPPEQTKRLLRWIKKYGPVATARAAGHTKAWIYDVLEKGSTSPPSLACIEALRDEDLAAMERVVRGKKIDMGLTEAARVIGGTRRALLDRLGRLRAGKPNARVFELGRGVSASIAGGYRWVISVPESLALRGTPEPEPPPVPPVTVAGIMSVTEDDVRAAAIDAVHSFAEALRTQPPKPEPAGPEFAVVHTQAITESLQERQLLQVHAEQLRQKLVYADNLVRAWLPVVRAAEEAIVGDLAFAEAFRKLNDAVKAMPENVRPSFVVKPT